MTQISNFQTFVWVRFLYIGSKSVKIHLHIKIKWYLMYHFSILYFNFQIYH
jgi:hypothetical protein